MAWSMTEQYEYMYVEVWLCIYCNRKKVTEEVTGKCNWKNATEKSNRSSNTSGAVLEVLVFANF